MPLVRVSNGGSAGKIVAEANFQGSWQGGTNRVDISSQLIANGVGLNDITIDNIFFRVSSSNMYHYSGQGTGAKYTYYSYSYANGIVTITTSCQVSGSPSNIQGKLYAILLDE